MGTQLPNKKSNYVDKYSPWDNYTPFLPTVYTYLPGYKIDSAHRGAHALVLETNGMRVYYSYKTIVAFWTKKTGLICSENKWGPTTGRHLGYIEPDRKARYQRDLFVHLLEIALEHHHLGL